MSGKRSSGHWVNTKVAAAWLDISPGLFRVFVLHCLAESKFPMAVDRDGAYQPKTAVNTDWIHANFDGFSDAYAAWRARPH